jgi:hypothetical protein
VKTRVGKWLFRLDFLGIRAGAPCHHKALHKPRFQAAAGRDRSSSIKREMTSSRLVILHLRETDADFSNPFLRRRSFKLPLRHHAAAITMHRIFRRILNPIFSVRNFAPVLVFTWENELARASKTSRIDVAIGSRFG